MTDCARAGGELGIKSWGPGGEMRFRTQRGLTVCNYEELGASSSKLKPVCSSDLLDDGC